MLKKFLSQKSNFMSYFKEADDDENADNVSVTVAPRQNRGTDYTTDETNVKAAPRQNRGTDYTQDDSQDNEETDNPPEETGSDQSDTNTEDNNDADNNPPPEENQDAPDENNQDNPEENQDENTPEGDTEANGDEGADGDAEDGPDTEGGGDYSDENNEDSDTENNDEGNSEDDSVDKVEEEKKYYMYIRFIHLYNVLESIIEKCKNVVKTDATQNAVIKTVVNNFTDIYNNLYDYMTIKYKTSTYIQVSVYFETVVALIKLNFELLRNNKINLKQ